MTLASYNLILIGGVILALMFAFGFPILVRVLRGGSNTISLILSKSFDQNEKVKLSELIQKLIDHGVAFGIELGIPHTGSNLELHITTPKRLRARVLGLVQRLWPESSIHTLDQSESHGSHASAAAYLLPGAKNANTTSGATLTTILGKPEFAGEGFFIQLIFNAPAKAGGSVMTNLRISTGALSGQQAEQHLISLTELFPKYKSSKPRSTKEFDKHYATHEFDKRNAFPLSESTIKEMMLSW